MSARHPSFVSVADQQGHILLDKVLVANSHWLRFRGLMMKRDLAQGEGMLFPKTNAIHCFFMRMCIDLIFLNREMTVVRVIEAVKPWRISPIVTAAVQVLECAEGTARNCNIEAGMQLRIERSGPH